MKKTIITILAVSAGIFAISACQKNLSDVQTSQVITKTVTVSDTPWTADTKTAFTEADGIKITGKENMAVFYYAGDKTTTVSGVAKTYATPDGKGGYTFSHDAAEGSTYNYWFVLPYTSRIDTNDDANAHTFWLHPTQFPTEDSFDSNMDALVAQAQYGVAAKTSVSDVKFRRLFSHLELKLSDGKSVLGSEKIHAVTFALGTTATKSSALTGIVYPSHSDEYNDAANTMETPGNAVTAHYPAGLAKNSDGTYHIWYVVNPVAVAANTEITVTVTADTKTITRTVALSEAREIMKGKINLIEFDITGAGYTTQESAYYDFTVSDKANLSSDWEAGSAVSVKSDDTGSSYSNSFYLKAKDTSASLLYTVPSGKTLTGIKMYIHPKSANSKTGVDFYCNSTCISTFALNYAEGAECAISGGYKYYYDNMPNSSGTKTYPWPEETITSVKFVPKNKSSYSNPVRFVDAVVLFGTATAGE